ncbi:MAG: hypothetical protein ACLP7F_23400 [Acidimicrobiales bacterium]
MRAETGSRHTPTSAGVSPGAAPAPRHDPRIDPPNKSDRRRLLAWVVLLTLTPICVGVVIWAALGLNGNYPTVAPPVPRGWQAVPGVYASFSVPRDWTLQQFMSDAAGDVYYAGAGGGAGESVTEADVPPLPRAALPQIVETFLGGHYRVLSVRPFHLARAALSWQYQFRLADGKEGLGTMAWVRTTESEVWLVGLPASATTKRILSTLTVAS